MRHMRRRTSLLILVLPVAVLVSVLAFFLPMVSTEAHPPDDYAKGIYYGCPAPLEYPCTETMSYSCVTIGVGGVSWDGHYYFFLTGGCYMAPYHNPISPSVT